MSILVPVRTSPDLHSLGFPRPHPTSSLSTAATTTATKATLPSYGQADSVMSHVDTAQERPTVRKHPSYDMSQDGNSHLESSPKRFKSSHPSSVASSSREDSKTSTQPARSMSVASIRQASASPDSARPRSPSGSETPLAAQQASQQERRLSRSPPLPSFAQRSKVSSSDSAGVGRVAYQGHDPVMAPRTSAADAFRSVRGEGRDREAGSDGIGMEGRVRQSASFAPISPADSSASFGRPRVSSNASDKERRLDVERERGQNLPAIRTPRSPAFASKYNSPGPSLYSSRPPPGPQEGSSLAAILPPPPLGFGTPGSRGLPPLGQRRQHPEGDMVNESPAHARLPHVTRSERSYTHGSSGRPDVYQGHHEPLSGGSGALMSHHMPPSLPMPGYDTDVPTPAGALPLAYHTGPEGVHNVATGIPGSLSSLGSQSVPVDRRPVRQQPSFVNKLYSMLEDERISHMISWAPSGTVFSVANPSIFSKVVLPQWFKHSNWQSFVRQLNMYGFNKVNQTFQGDPIDEIQVWEFRHPRFRRGEVHLLNEIKRKNSRQKRTMSPTQSVSGGDYESRKEASPTPSPEMSSMSMDEHARHLPDPRMRGDDYGYPAPGPSTWQGPAHAHMGMPYAHDGGPVGNVPPPPHASQGVPPPGQAEGDAHLAASLRDQHHRLTDMSERIDAIIRHSNYLETQLRSVTDKLHQSQQAEQAIAVHVSRTLNHLINLGTELSAPEHRDRGRGEEIQQSILAACRAELDYLRSYVAFDGPPLQAGPPSVGYHGHGGGPHEGMGEMPSAHAGRQHPTRHAPPPPPPPQPALQGPSMAPPRGLQAVPSRSTSLVDRRQSMAASPDMVHAPPPPPPGGAAASMAGPGPGPGPGPSHVHVHGQIPPGPPGPHSGAAGGGGGGDHHGAPHAGFRRESYDSDALGRRN